MKEGVNMLEQINPVEDFMAVNARTADKTTVMQKYS